MATTLYASFEDAALAEKAAGALMDHGVRAEDISLVSRGATNVEGVNNVDTTDTARQDYTTHTATLDERRTDTGYVRNPNYVPATENPADAAWDANRATADTDYADRNEENRDDPVAQAQSGFSTTTPGDAASGAAKGAGIGLGLGILAGIASLVVPGIGLVTGGGALATAIAGAAGATAAGAVAGGVHGYLMDQDVPDEVAVDYDRAVKNGGAVMAVQCPSNDVDEATCREILGKYGAININTYGGTYGTNYTANAA